MIPLSALALDVLTRSHRVYCAVDSWLDGRLLAAEVPIADAVETAERTSRIPERVTLTVPRLDRGVSWSPATDEHPLAANGQQLHVKLGVGLAGTEVEWFARGRYVIYDSGANGDVVDVAAVGMLTLVDEARLVSPFQPSGTLVSTLRALVEPALTVSVDSALVDRSVPAGINFDEDRLGAVFELLDAWPADAMVDPQGFLAVGPATQSLTPVLALTDGAGGTVITAPGGSTRSGACNVVVARGTAADGGQVQGVAFDQVSTSPLRYGGPYNPLPVPFFYASPLLTSPYEAGQAAATILARRQRAAGREFTVAMTPHPGLQLGDVVSLTTGEVTALPCAVERLTLPYLAGGGQQTLTVRSLA